VQHMGGCASMEAAHDELRRQLVIILFGHLVLLKTGEFPR